MFKKILAISLLFLTIVACSGGDKEEKLVTVKPLQKNDKYLTCRELLLEMNEAQFYGKMAHQYRGITLMSIILPLGYISTYVDSGKVIKSAQARVEYLDRIYQIVRCEEREKALEKLPIYQP